MRKRSIAVVLVIVMICSLMTGCMQVEYEFKFNSDESGEIAAEMLIADEVIAYLETTAEEMFAEDIANGAELIQREIDGVAYSGVSDTIQFKSVEYFNKLMNGEIDEDGNETPDGTGGIDATSIYAERMTDGIDDFIKLYFTASMDITSDEETETLPEDESIESTDDIPIRSIMTFTFPYGIEYVTGPDAAAVVVEGNSATIDSATLSEYYSDSAAETITLNCVITGNIGKTAGYAYPGFHNFTKGVVYDGRFTDVPNDAWYHDTVAQAYEYEFVQGTSNTTYAPNRYVNVAELLTMAARIHSKYNGIDAIGLDKDYDRWYEPFVNYCIDRGICDADTFDAYDRPATRAEAAVVVSRLVPSYAFKESREYIGFEDVDYEAEYAEAVETLYEAYVTEGTSDTTFGPKESLTRAQIATFMVRVINMYDTYTK